MSYEDTSRTTDYNTGLARKLSGFSNNVEVGRTATQRVDHADGSSVTPEELLYTGISADVAGPIGPITTKRPDSGQGFGYEILNGNAEGHFEIVEGSLRRVEGATLSGSYGLIVRVTEGSPLNRSFPVHISVTVAA